MKHGWFKIGTNCSTKNGEKSLKMAIFAVFFCAFFALFVIPFMKFGVFLGIFTTR